MKKEEYRNFVTKSLEEASEIARNNYGKVSSTVKSGDNNQVLTETDVAIGKMLVRRIQKDYPEHNIIDEEAGVIDNKSVYTWVVDPIDGTSNFASGIPLYGIFLALLEKDVPIAGGLALPSFNEIYTAVQGLGTQKNGVSVSVTGEQSLMNVLVAYGIDGHQENPNLTHSECKSLGYLVLGMRNLRSSNSAYDFGLLVDGRYGAFINRTSKIWDNVAAQILVEEAGGKYTDTNGNPIDYSNPLTKADDNFTYIAASPELHRQILDILNKE